MPARVLPFLSLFMLVAAFGAAQTQPGVSSNGHVFNLERFGAGVPGGWLLDGSDYTWEADTGPGRIGPGAGRLLFGDHGRIEITSPARHLESGRAYTLLLWFRSEPADAALSVSLHDNETRQTLAFEQAATATREWQQLRLTHVLPKAGKDCYYLRLSANGANTTLWLDGLWLGATEAEPPADWQPEWHAAAVAVEPDAPWGVVAGTGPVRYRIRVAGATAPGAQLQTRIVSTSGETASQPPIPLDTTGSWTGTAEITGDIANRFGMFRVEATVVAPSGTALSPMTETLLARAPEPFPAPFRDSYFGIHAKLIAPDLEAMARLGYKWLRLHDASGITKWGLIEPEPGRWLWYDDEVALAREKGFFILGLLDSAPPWDSGAEEEGYFSIYSAPKNLENWRNYVRRVVAHYKGAIDDWEVWNEPWNPIGFFKGGNPQLYTELLKIAFTETRAVHPEAVIVGIDTWPPYWDAMTLAAGAYDYYDVLSFHRYDPGMHGYPNDPIDRVAKRLRTAQENYGEPKPLLFSEGGPDVTVFHGSFFSFAEPALTGDWSWCADQYARMFLTTIASGTQRFFAYSVHNQPHHGESTHMMVEPGPLLRPLHLTAAALAHFVDGAHYVERLQPAHDISAHVFAQPHDRPYAAGGCTVVVLHANGLDPEPLPRPLPADTASCDRWGNPCALPTEALRSPVYLVAAGSAASALTSALAPAEPDTQP
ncbi:MAG TPA: hypothetical protein PLD73_02460 [Candidatus Hydrogenedentes bacterium]|jgi:hypothetical protein|nr:hypothetical protein [Candidatus Hydrogenedentota bacterium]HPJ98162.1 hypothetical protein [Candidatus Hydrogenedentota bacterium]